MSLRSWYWTALAVLMTVGTAVRIPQLSNTLNEFHSFRQTQTAFAIRGFARDGIDLLNSPMPIFGRDSSVPMEFPLFQAIAALLVPLGLDAGEAARTVALFSFQVSAILLALVALRWHGRAVSLIAIGLFEFSPFGLFWGAASLIEFLAVALALGMVLGFMAWLDRRSIPGLVLGSISAVLAFLIKVTTAPTWVVMMLAAIVLASQSEGVRRIWRRALIGLAAGPGLGLVAALVWARHADSVKLANPLSAEWASSRIVGWNLGTLSQRADPAVWGVLVDRVSFLIVGPAMIGVVLALLALLFAHDSRTRWQIAAWLATGVSAPLVFLNLYWVHEYYLAAVYPALVALTAIGIVWVSRAVPAATWRRNVLAAGAALFVLMLCVGSGTGTERVKWSRAGVPEQDPAKVASIASETRPDDLVVMAGCGMDPTLLYLADRQGLSFTSTAQVSEMWQIENIDDYRYLFRCDVSQPGDAYLPSGYRTEPVTGELYHILPTSE